MTRRHLVSLESIAMTDVVLNLFIFFFISFSLLYTFDPSRAKQIKVNLPKARNVMAPDKKRSDVVEITLSGEGPVYLGSDVVTLAQLETKLGERRKMQPDVAVFVRVDRQVPFKDLVGVLDVLNGLGLENLRIAAQQEK
ncbi:MAG: ExbD/TolR family protein [Deltaproteobacteria bacterium]